MAPRGRQTDCFRLHSIGTNIPTLSRSFFFLSFIYLQYIYDPSGRQRVCGSIFDDEPEKEFFFFFFLK